MENETIKSLESIVERHTVRYQVWPHCEVRDGRQVMVAYDLELHGTHDHGSTRLSPGCNLCTETFADLRKIAACIIPKEESPSRYEVQPYDQSLHGSAKGPLEVILAIRIEHRHDFFSPVDDCEQRCLKQMEQNLAEIGVQGGRGTKVQ